jgi:hypothetical protein
MAECQAMMMLSVPASSRASSLPQVQWLYAKSAIYPNHCGSELARDGGVSGNEDVECAGLIASKLAPTGSVAVRKICGSTPITVGASLLAMAECQVMMMLEVPASSRASSLPQVQWLYAKSAIYPNHCGSELARDGGMSGNDDVGGAGLIASKLAPTGSVAVRKICGLPQSLWERACSRWRNVR